MKDNYEPNTIRMCDTIFLVSHTDNGAIAAKVDSNLKRVDQITLTGKVQGQG